VVFTRGLGVPDPLPPDPDNLDVGVSQILTLFIIPASYLRPWPVAPVAARFLTAINDPATRGFDCGPCQKCGLGAFFKLETLQKWVASTGKARGNSWKPWRRRST
jgi:hypothetical protein